MGWFRKINKNGEDYKPIGNVITATSLSVAGPVLADGDVVRVMFTTDIAGSDTSTPLALTWNGGASPIPVKVAKEGSLASVYAHEVATNIFKYISGYVTLEMAFDGTNLVIIGNPIVLSGAGYTIYANGYKERHWDDTTSNNFTLHCEEINNILTFWGTVPSNTSTVTYPKTFLSIPTILTMANAARGGTCHTNIGSITTSSFKIWDGQYSDGGNGKLQVDASIFVRGLI